MRIRGASLIPILDQALETTDDCRIHLHLVEILAALTPCKQLQNVLVGCLHHISPPVRRRAMVALGDFGDKEAIYYLNDVAQDKGPLGELLDEEDFRLLSEAVQKIERRVRYE